MNRTEYQALREQLHRLYKYEWPLRIGPIRSTASPAFQQRQRDVLEHAMDEQQRQQQEHAIAHWAQDHWHPQIDTTELVMKRILTKGHFGFVVDKSDHYLRIIQVTPPKDEEEAFSFRVGHLVLDWAGQSIDTTTLNTLYDPQEEEHPYGECIAQMIQLCLDIGIERSSTIPFPIRTVHPPSKCEWIVRHNRRSKLQPKAHLVMLLQDNYINLYTSMDKATLAPRLQHGLSVQETEVHYDGNNRIELTTWKQCWLIETTDWLNWMGILRFAREFSRGEVNLKTLIK